MILLDIEVFILDVEKQALIESIIKQNPNYKGNEHLLEQFCTEVYKKSYLLLDSVSNIDSLKNYLTKVVDNSISTIVKNSKILNNDSIISEHVPKMAQMIEIDRRDIDTADEIKKIFAPQENKIVSIYSKNNEKKGLYNPYDGLIDPLEMIKEKPINPVLAQNLVDAVKKIHEKDPNKKFKEIFTMRYIQKMHQSVIAKNLKISQDDLSKRFCEMVKLVRDEIL